jgi:hypothetical protein
MPPSRPGQGKLIHCKEKVADTEEFRFLVLVQILRKLSVHSPDLDKVVVHSPDLDKVVVHSPDPDKG